MMIHYTYTSGFFLSMMCCLMRVSLEEFAQQNNSAKLATVKAAAEVMKDVQPVAKNYHSYLQVDRVFDDQILYIMYESMYAHFEKAA